MRDAAVDAALTDAGLGCDGALDCQMTTLHDGHLRRGPLRLRAPRRRAGGRRSHPRRGRFPHAVALDGELYIAKGLEGLEIWDLSAFPLPPSLRLERHLEGEEGSVDHPAVATDRIDRGAGRRPCGR
ncbi:MAG: hypothetical protein R3F43_19890 [bacterium]